MNLNYIEQLRKKAKIANRLGVVLSILGIIFFLLGLLQGIPLFSVDIEHLTGDSLALHLQKYDQASALIFTAVGFMILAIISFFVALQRWNEVNKEQKKEIARQDEIIRTLKKL